MSPSRRLTALLLQVALLALPLGSARAGCGGDHAGMTEMAGMPAMAGMTMPADADSGDDECDTGSQCANMLACGATLMAVEPLLASLAEPVAEVDALHFPRDPLSVTRAPEPPPPRA